jgi:glyoxylase-like metal-dependent hydrolase (beta-lactamase superfamily II)
MKKNFMLLSLFIMMSINRITAQEQESSIFTFKVGDIEITTLSEGQQRSGTTILIDAPSEVIETYAPNGTYPASCNAFFVKTADKHILIDAGFGRKLFENLSLINITPEPIDAILLTHAHGDHIGGLLKNGQVAFKNAELYIAKTEANYWLSNSSTGGQNVSKLIAAYGEKLRLFEPTELADTTELLSGIRAIAAFGHTPGHTAFLLKSESEQMLVWGDLTHAMAIQMPHPEIAVTYDVNPQEAVATRAKILEYVAANKITVAGMHIAFPAMGNITANNNGGYEFNAVSE